MESTARRAWRARGLVCSQRPGGRGGPGVSRGVNGPAGVAGPGSWVGVGRRPAQGLRGLGGPAEAEGRTAAGPAQLRAASKRARRLRSQSRSPMSCVTVTRGVITAPPVGAHDSSRGCAGALRWAGGRSGAGVRTGAGDGGHPTPRLSAFRLSWGAARTSDVPVCPRKCKHARCDLAGMGGGSRAVCWACAVHAIVAALGRPAGRA